MDQSISTDSESKEINMDELLSLDSIRGVFYDEEDGVFFTVSNKKNNKLGFFLTRYNCNDISKDSEEIIVLNNKLNIDDVTLQIIRGKNKAGKPYKELVIGYKTIYLNTYQVTV